MRGVEGLGLAENHQAMVREQRIVGERGEDLAIFGFERVEPMDLGSVPVLRGVWTDFLYSLAFIPKFRTKQQ